MSGPSTYLHCGIKKGWPHDHSVDDAYEAPPLTWEVPMVTIDTRAEPNSPEYKAEFGTDGSARLFVYTPRRLIGTFDTFADAQLAAEALNNHRGY